MTVSATTVGLVAVAALFALGLVALVARRNLVRILLGIQILGKAATLTFVLGGFAQDDLGRAQAIVFTIISIEVAVTALALGMMVNLHRKIGSLEVESIRRLRG